MQKSTNSNKKIWLSPPCMTGKEMDFIKEAFDTNWISPVGPNIDGFEKDLVNYTGAKYSVALSSGTAAIHLALIALGVKPGDEVICPSFTFIGSANPIVYVGATPVFIDSEKETWNMDPILLEEAILDRRKLGKKVSAIILVHLYGMPAKIKEIQEIANRYHISIIEDAAEAIGSEYNNKKVGTFGDIGILSFNGNKIITTSGGGAILTDNEEYAAKIKFLSTQARDKAIHYQHSEIGFNYRMSNICAGIGRGQIQGLAKFVVARRNIFDRYREKLVNRNIKFLTEPSNQFSNRWLTTILFDNAILRNHIMEVLNKDDIESRPLWKPLHLQPVYQSYPFYGKVLSSRLFEVGLCLPSGSHLTDSDQSRIINLIIKNL